MELQTQLYIVLAVVVLLIIAVITLWQASAAPATQLCAGTKCWTADDIDKIMTTDRQLKAQLATLSKQLVEAVRTVAPSSPVASDAVEEIRKAVANDQQALTHTLNEVVANVNKLMKDVPALQVSLAADLEKLQASTADSGTGLVSTTAMLVDKFNNLNAHVAELFALAQAGNAALKEDIGSVRTLLGTQSASLSAKLDATATDLAKKTDAINSSLADVQSRVDSLSKTLAATSASTSQLKVAVDDLQTTLLPALTARVAAVETAVQALKEPVAHIAEHEKRLVTVEASVSTLWTAMTDPKTGAPAKLSSVTAAVDALSLRVDAVVQDLANLNKTVAGLLNVPIKDGSAKDKAAPSAMYIQKMYNNYQDGVYWIDLPTDGPTPIYCILNPACAGGGWMLSMKGTRGTTFGYSSTHWTTATTLNPTETNRGDKDAKFATFNRFPARDWLAIFPDVSSGGDVSGGYNNGFTWVETNVTDAAMTAMDTFKGDKQYTKYAAGSTYGANVLPLRLFSKWDSRVWSKQEGFQWYGINYKKVGDRAVRWGFAWNNEADENSNDVSGGIGMAFGNFSAADAIGCCESSAGVNRTMRFEFYVR